MKIEHELCKADPAKSHAFVFEFDTDATRKVVETTDGVCRFSASAG